MVHNVVIIGSGPAGLTAGIYAGRAKLNPLIIDGPQPGGQLMTTTAVENWPGDVSILGPDLMINMREQAQTCGARFLSETVTKVDFSKRPFTIFTAGGQTVQAQSVIVATGAVPKKLNCPGETEHIGRGVSMCGTCDAPLYAGKDVVIVGSGNTAVTEAEHLVHIAKSVTLVFITDQLTATDPIKDKVVSNKQIRMIANTTVTQIIGDSEHVTSVVLEHQKDKKQQTVKTDGVFVAIGTKPSTSFLNGQLALDQYGYLVVRDHTKTSVDGVFAAGDVADYRYRQAVTSAGVGCMAALDAQSYLASRTSK